VKHCILAAVLAIGLGTSIFAGAVEAESVVVTIRGVLEEDKNGFFITVDGGVYDISVNDESKADMHKFYTTLEGDMVKVVGSLHVYATSNGKSAMTVFSNDITRLKGEKIVRAAAPSETIVVREHYVERPRGINLPFVHINW
jgi:hypothetical protein